jgi:tRNA threonylcarbamoyladenosine biosynthesis protein TsaB
VRKKQNDFVILAADTSSANLSLALWKGGRLAGKTDIRSPRGKTHRLVWYLDRILKKTRTRLDEVRLAAFGFGPGSYTGLRVGLAVLKALALAHPGLGIVRFSSMDLIAARIRKPRVAVAVDARREKIYFNFYRTQEGFFERLHETPWLLTAEEAAAEIGQLARSGPLFLAGDALDRYRARLEGTQTCKPVNRQFWYPKTCFALPLIRHEIALRRLLTLREVRPCYLRPSEAEEKWGICYDERDLERSRP